MFSTFLLLLSKVTNQKFITLLVGKPSPDTLHSVLMDVVIGLQLHPASVQVRGERTPQSWSAEGSVSEERILKPWESLKSIATQNHLTQRHRPYLILRAILFRSRARVIMYNNSKYLPSTLHFAKCFPNYFVCFLNHLFLLPSLPPFLLSSPHTPHFRLKPLHTSSPPRMSRIQFLKMHSSFTQKRPFCKNPLKLITN